MKHRSFFLAGTTGLFLLFNSCATNPVTGKKDVILVSEGQELSMGQQADPQITAEFGLYPDEKLQRFINQKGQEMVKVSHRSNITYTFKVLDSPVINAFAVPGGYVYFTRGIMAHFNNEAQFAGVLGHEIGHVAARHSAQQQSKSILAQVGLVVGIIAAPELAQFAEAASQGVSLLFLKFGRDDERESDELGVEYSTKIGYDAREMADFFTTLQRTQEQSGAEAIPDFLSTHPNPGDRFQTVNQLAQEWLKKTNLTNPKVNRDSYLRLIDGIIYGDDPKQGFVENSVFYHPELKFLFPIPQGWQFQNSPQQFQMAPKDGKALMTLTLVPGKTPEEAAQQMVQKNQLTVVESRKVTVNGLPALSVVADQAPQQQGQAGIRAVTYFIQYNGAIYSLMGVSLTTDFKTYAPSFYNTMQNFSVLTDSEKLNRQPERVRIKTVAQSTTLGQALKGFGTPDKRLEELAILNGMALNDQVTKGMLLKTVSK